MKWYEKFLIVPLVLATGWSFGWSSTIIYAHHHHHHPVPGVDKPFDPANYWTEDTISVPDSAPSRYALKDLAANGYQVYDKNRHLKSIETVKNYVSQLQMVLSQLGVLRDKSTMFSAGTTSQMKQDLADISDAVYTGTTQVAFSDELASPYYHAPSEDGKLGIAPSGADAYLSQSAYRAQQLAGVSDYMSQAEENQQNLLQALTNAVNASESATGTNELMQASNQIRALKTLSKAQSAQMLAEISKAEALEKDQEAENQRSSDAAWEGRFGIHIFDPKDPIDRKMIESYCRFTGDEPYESKPMPDFE